MSASVAPVATGRRRYPGLDGVRAVALLAVFFVHYRVRPSSRWVEAVSSQGFCGVSIFFVLSGFLITGILWDSRLQPRRYRDFFARRALRILPLYYLIWIGVAAVTPFARWRWSWPWWLHLVHLGNYARFLFYRPNDVYWLDLLWSRGSGLFQPLVVGHFWTLCVEEQFYLLWPLLVYRCKTREQLRTLCLCLIALGPLCRVLLQVVAPERLLDVDLIYRVLPSHVDALGWGALIAVMLRGPEVAWLRRHNGTLALCLSGCAVLYWAVCACTFGAALPGPNDTVAVHGGLICFNLLGVGIVLRATHAGSETERALAWQPLAALGTISYGFYVLHDFLHAYYLRLVQGMRVGPLEAPLTALVGFVATLVLSVSLFYGFERPVMRYKRFFGGQTHRARST